MLTTKNKAPVLALLFCFVVMLAASGCKPAGVKALLDGKTALDQGAYEQAIKRLQLATTELQTNAHAWNYLGMAYHASGQTDQALNAYRTALKLDNNYPEINFNLGCLFLETEMPDLAKQELLVYTLRRQNDPLGFVKLGFAQLKSRDFASAEKSFAEAIRLDSASSQAYSGLGLVRLQRNRASEALQLFSTALHHDPANEAALLNSAVVYHQYLNNKPAALDRYRQYVAAGYAVSNLPNISTVIRQLEQDLAPKTAAVSPIPKEKPGQTGPAGLTNAVLFASTNSSVIEKSSSQTNVLASGPAVPPKLPANTNLLAATSPRPAPKQPEVARPERDTPVAYPIQRAESKPPPKTTGPTKVAPTPVQMVQVAPEPVIAPLTQVSNPKPEPPQSQVVKPSVIKTETPPAQPPKKSVLQKLNPANLLTRRSKEKQPDEAAPILLAGDTATRPPDRGTPRTSSASSDRQFKAYRYSNPTPGTPGNRKEAEASLRRGVQAQERNQMETALSEYEEAATIDPTFFDAHYNTALAALIAGNLPLALSASEMALALKADSVDARYNFALALRRSNFINDAIKELDRLVQDHKADDPRVHFALAGIYAQDLQDSSKARVHYERTLELSPNHPSAAKIRFWLKENPRS